ncbi:MAG: asparagine synthetase B [Gemmatimonadales bacterium]|nr:asparagine synthetase B [Gemmatimonadales bacterium]NCG33088.1 asparagine synthetase B [Pseudomonadota bacterium]MBT3498854.1 asparagine synthetase B [Gemmatimonadales bacterium]MBT3775521.1 asparagine synthetase B [Gemmatimonadales bacterium]MBT3957364.1 asparagine synthetase B [Gemmatimonadales bacterium]
MMVVALSPASIEAQWLLVPMDGQQQNHLRAYGLTYWALQQDEKSEWLLNYRGGSFLLPDTPELRREAAVRGVSISTVDASAEARIRATIAGSNMEAVPLERAPKVAIYTPPNSTPWDDAVTMVLEYAGIEYETIWDPQVLNEDLNDYEWIHLHHEDFTGQYSKFYLTYAGAPWLQEEVARNQEVARSGGFSDVPALKKEVAARMRAYVENGGFLFAMCSATETLELALAARDVDISAAYSDGTPPDANASAQLDWGQTLAFEGAEVQIAPSVSSFSDIDGHQVNTPWRKELGVYTLFDFSAKFDPVPSMLTQNHESVLPDFYGLTTSFREDRIKSGTIVLAQEGGWAKYVHGNLGEGTWTYFGGHDPEDPEHQIGDPPTDLALHPNSAGYRLILNNVLFPAAKKQKLKT